MTTHWKRDRIEQVWDVFAKHGLAFDRLSMYHDEGADSEFCEMHRRQLAEVLDKAGLVPLEVESNPKEYRMTAVEIAVKALIDITQEKDAPASGRCDAAQALVNRDFEGNFAFAGYDEAGQKVTA